MRDRADAVVVGGGHNGLVCAASLARAGYEVVVLEAAGHLGGALMSSSWAGHRLEHGALEHTAILSNGVVDALDLAQHGLEYQTRGVAGVHRFGDGSRIVIGESAEATAASIAELSPGDAEAWLRLAPAAVAVFEAVGIASRGSRLPSPSLVRALARVAGGRRGREIVELTAMSVLELSERWFTHPAVRATVLHRAQFSGVPPWTPGTALAFLITLAGHGRRFGRPVGGSSALVTALRSSLEAAGGEVRTSAPVLSVTSRGAVWSVATSDGTTVAAPIVVSAMAPDRFLLELVQPLGLVPSGMRRRLAGVVRTIDGVGQLTVAAAVAGDGWSEPDHELAAATQWLLRSPADLVDSYSAARVGALPAAPPVLAAQVDRMDPSAAPTGASTMWLNAFVAQRLSSGPWNDASASAIAAMWRTIEACGGPAYDAVAHVVLTSPEDLEARLGTENAGNHVAPTPAQSLSHRPVRGLGRYRTPLPGVYLTGAGTHPGGGIGGASGLATAAAIIADRRPRLQQWTTGVATLAAQARDGLALRRRLTPSE